MNYKELFTYMDREEVNLLSARCSLSEGRWGSFLVSMIDNHIEIPQRSIPVYWKRSRKDSAIQEVTAIQKWGGLDERLTHMVTLGKFSGFLVYPTANRDTHAHLLLRPLRSETTAGTQLQQRLEKEFNVKGEDWFARGMVTLLERAHIPVDSASFIQNCQQFSQAVVLYARKT